MIPRMTRRHADIANAPRWLTVTPAVGEWIAACGVVLGWGSVTDLTDRPVTCRGCQAAGKRAAAADLDSLGGALNQARETLAGDSNDAEHDALSVLADVVETFLKADQPA